MKTPKTSLLARMKAKKADPKKKPMTVEGSAAKPRLDRPMRMKRAEGGEVSDRLNGLAEMLPVGAVGSALGRFASKLIRPKVPEGATRGTGAANASGGSGMSDNEGEMRNDRKRGGKVGK